MSNRTECKTTDRISQKAVPVSGGEAWGYGCCDADGLAARTP